jgi:hypothetical protein
LASTARLGGLVGLAGAGALAAAALATGNWTEVGSVQVALLVAFSVVVGLSTAASP